MQQEGGTIPWHCDLYAMVWLDPIRLRRALRTSLCRCAQEQDENGVWNKFGNEYQVRRPSPVLPKPYPLHHLPVLSFASHPWFPQQILMPGSAEMLPGMQTNGRQSMG